MRSIENEKTFLMFANPKKGEVYIDFEAQTSKTRYRVINKEGKIVCQNNNPTVRNTITLQTLPSDIYTVEVRNKNITTTKKFLRL